MEKVIFLLIFVLSFVSCHAVEDIDSVLKKMRETNCYMGSAVSDAGETPGQYKLYEIVRDSATTGQLEKLLSDKNGVIRAYAIQALVERDEKADYDKIALDSLSDTEKIEAMFGCIVSNEMVGDIFLEMLKGRISKKTQDEIDRRLLKSKSPLIHTLELLHGDKKSAELYELTRKWALDGNDNAVFALAKYQKKEDYELILSLKDKKEKFLFFKACPYILNDSLKPFFSEYMDSILPSNYYGAEWRSFYKSLAMFKDDFSKRELRKVFSPRTNKNIRKYHLAFIADALCPCGDGFYDDILFEMWEKYDAVNLDIAENLYGCDKNRALSCMVSTLNNADEYFNKTDTLSFSIETLLDEKYDIRKIFIKKLPGLSISVFDEFFKQIRRFADDDVDAALLNRLKTEQNGYVALPIYDYLLSKKNPLVTGHVLKIYEKNKPLYKDWVEQGARKTLEKWGAL